MIRERGGWEGVPGSGVLGCLSAPYAGGSRRARYWDLRESCVVGIRNAVDFSGYPPPLPLKGPAKFNPLKSCGFRLLIVGI